MSVICAAALRALEAKNAAVPLFNVEFQAHGGSFKLIARRLSEDIVFWS